MASSTGTGAGVFQTSPTLTTPVINGFTGDTSVINIGSGQVYKDASGNVGIGVSSIAPKLEVNGLGRFATAADKGVIGLGEGANSTQVTNVGLWRGGANSAVSTSTGIVATGGNFLNLGGYDGMAFTTGAASIGSQTERMRIDSSGNVLVGTTTNNSRNPRLALSGNSVTWSVGPTASNSVFTVYNASEVGVYLPSGNTAWVSTSDETLKNITGEITDAINKVSQLRAAEFTWKNDESNKPQVGLIAQDVQKVLPQVISENDKGILGVSYTEVIPLLVASIKELKAIIDTQQTQITALNAKVGI
jgi:hypothetical protein